MFPVLLACNMGALGGWFVLLAGVAVMTLVGMITSSVFMTQVSMGRHFSTPGLIVRIVTCLVLFAPAIGLTVAAL